jgi:DNA-directed RNA polymerase subunit RPC12/RpoP
MKKDEYKCALCKQIFKKGLTDEEAEEQFKKEFPNLKFGEQEQDVVCDDCFNKLNDWKPTKTITWEDLK